jgi:RNA polymerase sigma factor (sigma-70 family)
MASRQNHAGIQLDTREPTVLERLFRGLVPGLLRWTRGRLPAYARRRMDTADLVQEALTGALVHLSDLDRRTPESIRAYVQESIRNRIRDEIRRSGLGEVSNDTDHPTPAGDSSPLEHAIDAENERRFRAALAHLDPDDQALVVGRIDAHKSYEELAAATGKQSPDAARVGTRRAMLRLARWMAVE